MSPKQYIKTKARSLPIAFCKVNTEWEESGMAQVVVARQHITGQLTGAVFLIDLKCLGVKDAFCFFNQTKEDINKRFFDHKGLLLLDIPYNLAHNIIYAGHNYALDFHINPSNEFEIAKYILEEDNEAIPIIEIETGYKDKPWLMENIPGQYSYALTMLKKHAGEGNYFYTIGQTEPDDEEFEIHEKPDEVQDFFDENKPLQLDEIELGMLSPEMATQMDLSVLLDTEAMEKRHPLEQTILKIENIMQLIQSQYHNTDTEMPEWGITKDIQKQCDRITATARNLILNVSLYPYGISEDEYIDGTDTFRESVLTFLEMQDTQDQEKYLISSLQENGHNPAFLSHFAFFSIFQSDTKIIRASLKPLLEKNKKIPLIALTQTFLFLLEPEEMEAPYCNFESIELPTELYPDIAAFEMGEIALFYAIQTVLAARNKEISKIIIYYDLMAAKNAIMVRRPVLVEVISEIIKTTIPFIDTWEIVD